MTTLRLADMTVDQVRTEVHEVLMRGLDQERLAGFLASIDWGGTPGSPEVRKLLDALATASTRYAERDLTRNEYIDLLRGLAAHGVLPR